MFPQLTAAIADIAAFIDDEGKKLGAARQRAIDSYRDEMLPALLGGEWSHGQADAPWPDRYAPELFDHLLWFHRRGVNGARSWQTCAVLGSPYRAEIIDEIGEFTLDFLAAAQPLLERRVEVWTSDDWSWWFPGHTLCVLAAAGLEPKRASGFGFHPVRGIADFAVIPMAPAGGTSGSFGRRSQQLTLRR
jgi:hypothetical protein